MDVVVIVANKAFFDYSGKSMLSRIDEDSRNGGNVCSRKFDVPIGTWNEDVSGTLDTVFVFTCIFFGDSRCAVSGL